MNCEFPPAWSVRGGRGGFTIVNVYGLFGHEVAADMNDKREDTKPSSTGLADGVCQVHAGGS